MTVITNVDREHLDHYADLEALMQAFTYFANRVPFYGVSVLCADDPGVQRVLPRVSKRHVLYGTRPPASVMASAVQLLPQGSRFRVAASGRDLGEIELRVPGRHNVLNALAAVAVGLEIDVGFGHVAEALATFAGVARRFETRGEHHGVRVVDDYGHHPTEIEATLAAARGSADACWSSSSPIVTPAPRALTREFGAAFGDADRVWVLDIYAAGESPIAGVSGRSVVESARPAGLPPRRVRARCGDGRGRGGGRGAGRRRRADARRRRRVEGRRRDPEAAPERARASRRAGDRTMIHYQGRALRSEPPARRRRRAGSRGSSTC